MNQSDLKIVIISSYDKQGLPLYEGRHGTPVKVVGKALKFWSHAKAKDYYKSVKGHTNCITERAEFYYQTPLNQ